MVDRNKVRGVPAEEFKVREPQLDPVIAATQRGEAPPMPDPIEMEAIEARLDRKRLKKIESKKIDKDSTVDDLIELAQEALASIVEVTEEAYDPAIRVRQQAVQQIFELIEIKEAHEAKKNGQG